MAGHSLEQKWYYQCNTCDGIANNFFINVKNLEIAVGKPSGIAFVKKDVTNSLQKRQKKISSKIEIPKNFHLRLSSKGPNLQLKDDFLGSKIQIHRVIKHI